MTENSLFERLNRSGLDYLAHNVIGQARAVVDFIGVFADQPVVWHATIIALPVTPPVALPSKSHVVSTPDSLSARPAGQGAAESSQYIEISKPKADVVPVEIGLLVPSIDEPTVLKTIKMIRLYKNLQPGRHEFLGTRK